MGCALSILLETHQIFCQYFLWQLFKILADVICPFLRERKREVEIVENKRIHNDKEEKGEIGMNIFSLLINFNFTLAKVGIWDQFPQHG